MTHLPMLSAAFFAACTIAAVKILERAADKLTVEQRETLRQKMRFSGLDFLLVLAPIALGYLLLQRFPQAAFHILLATLFLVAATQAVSYFRGVRRVRGLGMPDGYISAYRRHHFVLGTGLVAVLLVNAWRVVSELPANGWISGSP